MTTFTSDADQTGLATGTAITTANSGGGTNTAASVVTGTITADSTGSPAHGAFSYLHAATSAAASALRFNFTGVSSCAARFYFEATTAPSTTVQLIQLGTSGSNYVGLTSGNKLNMVVNGSAIATASTALTAGVVYRIELGMSISTTVGIAKLDYYVGDSLTPVQTIANSTTSNTGSTNIAAAQFGKVSTAGTFAAFRTDELAWAPGQTTYIGPAATSYLKTAALAGSGSTTASAIVGLVASVTLAATGATTSTGVVGASTTAAISGTGSITAAAVVGTSTTATLSGTGSVTASGSVAAAALTATSTLTGSGSIASTATAGKPSSAALTGAGSITATARVGRITIVTLDGSGAITVSAGVAKVPVVTLSGTGSVTTSATVDRSVSATLAGTGAVAASALARVPAAPTPPSRIEAIAAEPRILAVSADPRVLVADADTRTETIPAESRTLTVPAEPRTVEVE